MATDSPYGVLSADGGPPERTAVRGRIFSKPSWLTLFYGAELIVAAALFALFVPRVSGNIEILLLLVAFNVASELMPINIYGKTTISVGFVFTTSIMILFGPGGVLIAAPIEASVDGISTRFPIRRVIHIAAMYSIAYAAGACAYALYTDVPPATFNWLMLPGAATGAAIAFGTNAMLMSFEQWLRTGQPVLTFWEKHRWLAPHFLTLGLVGVALASAYLALGVVGMLAFVIPAVMMRLTMKQYVDKTKENVAKLEMQNDALRTANIEVRRVSEELRVSYDGTLEALVNALDARDQETKGHSIRVSRYMMDIAREMGVVEGTQDWIDMQRGSLLHDVGKIGVSDSILLKPAKLTDEEWVSMKQHPEIGYNMLKQVKFLQGAAEIILCHHERWDGRGYPRGLNEEESPLGARIFTVVDTFDSMTSDRPYRKALTTLDALNEIMRCGGSQFDPRVVEAFLDTYETWVAEREELHRITVKAA